MAKYSYELKKKIVEEYLSGEGGFAYLAKKHGVNEISSLPCKSKPETLYP